MITEGEAAILLETTWRAFRNQSQSKQRSTLVALLRTVNSTWFFPHHMVFYRCVFAVTWSNIVLNLVYHKEYYVQQLSAPHSELSSVRSVLYYYWLQT